MANHLPFVAEFSEEIYYDLAQADNNRIRDVHQYGDVEVEQNAVNLFSMVGKHDGQRVKEDPNGRYHFFKSFLMRALAGCTEL